jgi:hypothetical protein
MKFQKYLLVLSMLAAVGHASSQTADYTEKQYDLESGLEIREMAIGGAGFKYVLNHQPDTVRIWTDDFRFETPEHYRVGMKLKELPVALRTQAVTQPGRGYFIMTSGYKLYFCEGEKCTGDKLTPASEIKWIERRQQPPKTNIPKK